MTTEKKKRTPKPTPTSEILFLQLLLKTYNIRGFLQGHGYPDAISHGTREMLLITHRFIREYELLRVEKSEEKKELLFAKFGETVHLLEKFASSIRFSFIAASRKVPEPILGYNVYCPDQKKEQDALVAYFLLKTFSGPNPPGPHYIGACPRCGKIFEKKRGDQEYCGKACASTERTIRQRKKEKP